MEVQVYLKSVNEIPFGSSLIEMYMCATNQPAAQMKQDRANRFAVISARYKIGKERAQEEEARTVPPLRRNLEPTRRAAHGEKPTK